jgi:hypothetical protein
MDKNWSDRIAGLAVDALLTAKVLRKEDLSRAIEIVSEEISVRLALGDLPSVQNVVRRK